MGDPGDTTAARQPMTVVANVPTMNNGGYAVGWFTLTFINSAIAQSKNRGGTLWWLISLFFDPIATAVLAVIPAEPPRTST